MRLIVIIHLTALIFKSIQKGGGIFLDKFDDAMQVISILLFMR